MNTKMFPYCLERSTNMKKDKIKEIECLDLLECVTAYKDAMELQSNIARECIAVLEHAYSVCQNPDILKAKRKMAAEKRITRTDISLGADCDAAIKKYNLQIEKTQHLAEAYRNLYSERLKDNRRVMRSFIEENDEVLRTLPLINKDFIYKLEKYLEIPVDEHNAKIRKLDHQLIRLFTRATMKTSPFSFLTSVCLYDFECDSIEKKDRIHSICEVNNYIIKAVYDFLIQKIHFAKQVKYRLNAYKEYDDSYIFLYQRDYEKGKVYKTVDGTARMKKTGIIQLLVERFKDKVFYFNDLVELFTANGIEQEKTEDIIYKKFILSNIITPDESIDDTKSDIYDDFYLKTGTLADDKEKTLEKVCYGIKEYERNVKQFVEADWKRRFAIVQTLDELVSEIEKVLECEFVHNILLYEDSVYEKPGNPVFKKDIEKYDLNKLQRCFRIFDQSVLTYLLFSELFVEKYGDMRVNAADLDVYKLFVEAASMLSDVWKDNFSAISFEAGEKIRKISELKKCIYSIVEERKEQTDPQDIKELIDEIIEKNPDIFDTDIDSATIFFQKSENGDLVINKVYKGQLLFFTRFLKLFEEDSKKIHQYCEVAFGKNPLEITESFGFNANVHKQIFDKRLVLNLTDQNDRTEQDILINNCYFYYDYEKKLVKLGNDDMGEVNGVYLGSLAYNLMPIPLRTINGMQPTTRFDASYLNLWDTKRTEQLVADHFPRMKYGNVVFMREQYLVNSIYNLKKPLEELYMEILLDFKNAGLPLKFFIRPYINGSDFDFYNMGRTSLKPQYIDLSSPLLFQELLREMENQKQFVIEEIYPDNKTDAFIYEYEIEQTLYR